MPLERDIKIAVNGPFWVEVANQERAIYGNVDIALCPIVSAMIWLFNDKFEEILRD